jgi:hypothetical protein
MLVVLTNPIRFAVALAVAGVCDGRRLYGAEVVFPDIGEPFLQAWWFLAPISREADTEELHISGVLTNHQKRSVDHG